MPDPVLYLQAMTAAALASALCVLALAWRRNPASPSRMNTACVLAIALGLAVGYCVLQLRWRWPPVNGLDRLLTIIIPAAIAIELVTGSPRVPRWLPWLLRGSLVAGAGRILLHGSVYLDHVGAVWTTWRAGVTLAGCALLLATVWGLLVWLSERSAGITIPLSLAMTIQCTGLTVILAGYVTGGAAAFPLSAALVGTTLASSLVASRSTTPGMIGVGVIGLFGLLFIGRYFGGLTTGTTLALFLAPLLCWTTELPIVRSRKPWEIAAIRLALVATPLIVVLVLAKQDFDRDTAPLLSRSLTLQSRASILISIYHTPSNRSNS